MAAAPNLEIVESGGGSSPSTSSKNTMFKVGKFKVTKPMFYVGGVVLMLVIVLIVKSRSSNDVATRYVAYPDGTESVDNGVDVAAQLQNFQNMMGNTLDGYMTQVDNNLNTAMKEMQTQNSLLATELRSEQSSIVAELKSSNQSLQSSLQSMLTNQINALKQSYAPVTASYDTGSYSGSSSSSTRRVGSKDDDDSYSTSWNYSNPAPTEDYSTSKNQAAYQQQMNKYLNEVNSTRQDAISYGVSTGDWQPERYFESTKNPQNFYVDSSGKLEYSSEYYTQSASSSKIAAYQAKKDGDLEKAAIWEKEAQKALEEAKKVQSSNLKK